MKRSDFDLIELLKLVKTLLRHADTKSQYDLRPMVEQLDRILPAEDNVATTTRAEVRLSPLAEIGLRALVAMSKSKRRPK